MPLTLNTGTARPREGVQPRKEGARLPQHACTPAGDIIELTGAHSQSLHTVEHGTHPPPPLSKKINHSEPSVLPASSARVTRGGSDNNKQQTAATARGVCCLPLSAFTYLSLSLPLLLFPADAGVSLRSPSAGMQIWFQPG